MSNNEHSENKRVGFFYDPNSFELDIDYSIHYLDTDLNMTFTLYRVNYMKTKSNNIYGETKAKDKTFDVGVELHGIVNLSAPENKNLTTGGIRRENITEAMFGVFKKELEKFNVKINIGDYIMYRPDGEKITYYEVTNPNYVDYSTSQTRAGIKSIYKRIIATPAREDIILKFNE